MKKPSFFFFQGTKNLFCQLKTFRRLKNLSRSKKLFIFSIFIISLRTIVIYLRKDFLTKVLLHQNISRHHITCKNGSFFDPVQKHNLFKCYFKNPSSFNAVYNELNFPKNFSQFKLCSTNQFKSSFKSESVHSLTKYSFYLNSKSDNLTTSKHLPQPICIQEFFFYLNESLDIFETGSISKISQQSYIILEKHKQNIKKFIEYKQNLTVIIIPFMNREENLIDMLHNLHRFLQRQFLNYKIFVAEQINIRSPFNKGRLYNLAFEFLKKRYNNINCFILQDVDLLPESDYNVYECGKTPRHLSGSIRSESFFFFNQKYSQNLYELLIGGVLCIRPEDYERINGFSNEFWYWGGEDDGKILLIFFLAF